MAAELQPPGLGTQLTTLLPGASAAAPQNVPPSSTTEPNPGSTLAPKRHRRPSVRLGDIGDQPATLRTSKPWRLNPNSHPHREHHNPNKSSKIRPLTNLVAPINGNFDYSSAETTTTNNNGIISHRKFPKEFKSKRATSTNSSKRVRTNLRVEEDDDEEERENGGNNHDFNEFDEDIDEDNNKNNNNGEEGFRDFDPEIDGPESPINSGDDVGVNLDIWHAHNRRSIRATRVSNSQQEMGMESNSRNRGSGLEEGVRKWLVELGLGRYAPVFEIHEVDEEVLPYLTLDDLKDMGINAVGSRRKLYSAIQNLRKGLS
ncbi:cyclic AMP receptor 3-like [Chenopodium quinoa]|uniref:cyclic AMP receptor 3-like n=1 Tax=Chenopodium quinoa TaxID=63459 RepID=UPI000B76E52F|nr:cyclic AMP receptor 3-like [Chenopodium quinoa]